MPSTAFFRRNLARYRKLFLGAIIIVALLTAAAFYYVTMPVFVDAAWQYTEIASDLTNISAVQTDAKGHIYALLEEKTGQGELLLLHDGIHTQVLGGLDKPDGMIVDGDDLIISEEAGKGRLIRFTPSNQQVVNLAILQSAEGIAVESDGDFLVVEDRNPGSLLSVSKNGSVTTLLAGLNKAEGVCTSISGRIYIAEKATGRILLLDNGKKSILINGLHKPGVVICGLADELWITEDKTNSGRLMHYSNNRLKTIARHLHNPQGISFDAGGRLLLAEQGRGRILAFTRKN